MLAVDSNGNLFDERRKAERRRIEKEVENERRVKERRAGVCAKKEDNDENQED